jgi:hypothetical protein
MAGGITAEQRAARLRAASARLEAARRADERRPTPATLLELERAEHAYERAATAAHPDPLTHTTERNT